VNITLPTNFSHLKKDNHFLICIKCNCIFSSALFFLLFFSSVCILFCYWYEFISNYHYYIILRISILNKTTTEQNQQIKNKVIEAVSMSNVPNLFIKTLLVEIFNLVNIIFTTVILIFLYIFVRFSF